MFSWKIILFFSGKLFHLFWSTKTAMLAFSSILIFKPYFSEILKLEFFCTTNVLAEVVIGVVKISVYFMPSKKTFEFGQLWQSFTTLILDLGIKTNQFSQSVTSELTVWPSLHLSTPRRGILEQHLVTSFYSNSVFRKKIWIRPCLWGEKQIWNTFYGHS